MSIPEGENEFDIAMTLFQGGRISEAKATLERALERDPENIACRYALGACQNGLREWESAEQHLRAVLASEQSHYLAAYELGVSLQEQGRLQEAASAFRQCLARANVRDAWDRLRLCETPAEPAVTGLRTATPVTAPPPDTPASALYGAAAASSPPLFRTLAGDLDERDVADTGDLVWSRRTCMRDRVPAAAVATLLAFLWWAPGVPSILVPVLLLYALAAWIAVPAVSSANRFEFYERRVDVAQGVLGRSRLSIWYASIVQVSYVRGAVSYLTNTASLRLTYVVGTEHKTVLLPAIGTPGAVARMCSELQAPTARERRAMKKILF